MDKKQSDHIDNRIRQAAEGVTPPFREEAWLKMEALLDDEFSKRRPKVVFWWWLLPVMLLGGIAFFYFNDKPSAKQENTMVTGKGANPVDVPKDDSQKEPGSAEGNSTPGKEVLPSGSDLPSSSAATSGISGAAPEEKGRAAATEKAEKAVSSRHRLAELPAGNGNRTLRRKTGPQKNSEAQQQLKGRKLGSPTRGTAGLKDRLDNVTTTAAPDQRQRAGSALIPGNNDTSANLTDLTSKTPSQDNQMARTGKAADDSSSTAVQEANADSSGSRQAAPPVKLSKEPFPKWYFIGAVSPDASALKGSPLNDIGTVYGLGIGYRITKRLSIQTGLSGGKKLYVAGPKDYVIKPGSYWSMVEMIKVDANCFILEIPLLARYDLLQRRKFNVYATGGASSVLMKSEDYNYHYRKNGVYHQSAYTFHGNKSLLSLVNLSAGYERSLSRAFFLQAEPYLKVPLSGVGEGKVKIYSAGLQVGLKYMPPRNKKVR